MSGLDVIAVLGLLASIEQLVESTYKVVNHAVAFYRNSKELPKTLEEVRTFLPFLAMAVRNRSDPSVLGRLNEEGRQALMSIFEELRKKIQELQKLLNDYLPSDDTSTSTKFLKAMGSLATEKKIDKIMKIIFERYMPVLTLATVDNPNLQTEVIKKAMETTSIESRTNPKPKPYFLVNVQRDDDFVGRQDVMNRLNALITPVERHNRVALVALGGMGKTRIALECALKYRKSEDVSVYWVHASGASRMAEAYDEMARQVGIAVDTNPTAYDLQALQKDKMKAMKKWLESEASGRWLMIIDNADDRDLLYGEPKLAEYFPRSDSGSIIMTTRDKTVGLKFTGSASKIIIVEAFNSTSSQSLLEAKLGSDTADEASCRELSDELEGMPLALVQAAAYINEQSISIQEYLALYRGSESSKINLLSEDFEDIVRNAQDTKSPVAITWVISFEIIRKRDPLAAEILSEICIMDSQALPLSLLEGNEDNQQLVKALGTLQAFSMITLRKKDDGGIKEKSFDLHRLVRLSMRNWLKMHTQLDYWTAMALKKMALKYPDIESTRWQHQKKWRAYLPHALAILTSDYFTVTSEQSKIADIFLPQAKTGQHTASGTICGLCVANLMCQVSWTFEILESKRDWALWAERGLSLREYILGPEHSDTISAMMLYAKATLRINRREEAEKAARRAIEIIARTQQPLPNQAKSLEAQAIVMSENGQHKEAEEMYMQMVEFHRNAFGPENNGTLVALDMLGYNYRQQGKYEEAEKTFKEVLEIRKRIFGPEYIDTLIVISHLASLYFEMERYDEAVSLDTALSEMWNNNEGPPHPSGIMAMGNLAADYIGQERYAEGVELALKALKLYEEVCGPDDYETLNTMSNILYAYRKMRQYDEAERYGSRMLELHKKTSGPMHMLTSSAMGQNALLYEDQKNYVLAEPLRKQALQITINTFGVHHDRTFQDVKNLLVNYELQRHFADMLACELDFLYMVTSALGPKHQDVVYRMSALATALANNERYNEAEETARSAMKLATECVDINQATMMYCKMTLGGIIGRVGKYREAELIFREVLEIDGKDQTPDNVGRAWTNSNLVTVLAMTSQLEEAETLAVSAHATLSEIGGSMGMYSTWVSSWLFIMTGRYAKAEVLRLDQLKMNCKGWSASESLQSWHFPILEAMAKLVELYSRIQCYDKAYRIISLIYRARTKVCGPKHSSTLDAMARLGWNSAHLGQREKGIRYNIHALEELETSHQFHVVEISYLKSSVARLYNLNEQYAEAETLILEVLSSESDIYLSKSIFTLLAKSILGLAYFGQGKFLEAEKTQLEVLERMKECIGPADIHTIDCMMDLARTYDGQGREREALALRLEAEDLRKKSDVGLSAEERKERWDSVESVIAWLEREVRDVEVWEP